MSMSQRSSKTVHIEATAPRIGECSKRVKPISPNFIEIGSVIIEQSLSIICLFVYIKVPFNAIIVLLRDGHPLLRKKTKTFQINCKNGLLHKCKAFTGNN